MSYPESNMNVAVHMGNAEVKIYGWEVNGFRPFVRKVTCDSVPKAIQYCADHNDNQRKEAGLLKN